LAVAVVGAVVWAVAASHSGRKGVGQVASQGPPIAPAEGKVEPATPTIPPPAGPADSREGTDGADSTTAPPPPTAQPPPPQATSDRSAEAVRLPPPNSRKAPPVERPIPPEDPAPEPLVPVPAAPQALSWVGADPEAEAVWVAAINDPAIPPNARKDLIEDLNEDGFPDPKHVTEDDLPLILSRIELIEQLAPDAMDEVNADAFREAYKDLVNMVGRLAGQ